MSARPLYICSKSLHEKVDISTMCLGEIRARGQNINIIIKFLNDFLLHKHTATVRDNKRNLLAKN